MSASRAGRKPQPGNAETPWIIVGVVLAFGIVAGLIWWTTAFLDPELRAVNPHQDPVNLMIDQATGTLPVTSGQLLYFTLGFGIFVLVGLLLAVAAMRARKNTARVDSAARAMSRSKDFSEMSLKAQTKDAQRLGAETAGAGVALADLVNNGQELRASWEWVQIHIMGPRAGKTSCICVPQVIEPDAPVLATSNKRDMVDLTRGPRSEKGVVWVHDPQDIIGEHASWWWNPLSFVEDMETAEKLADVFISSATNAGAKQDAYFESDGKRLLSHMFLAAAIDDRPVTDVFTWALDPDDETPVNALYQQGHPQLAYALEKIQQLTPKQRDGVYGTMRPWISVLGNDNVIPWIRDTGEVGRPEFNHARFATTTDTLYLISREGGGSARALTAALVMAVLTAAEQHAGKKSQGRLSPPMMAVLDEAANVVRWRELPDLYSHYGSRGIVVSSFFQSFTQGVEAFGKEGMTKLWSASNIRIAGSGLSEQDFLSFLSRLVGPQDVTKRTASTAGRAGRQISTAVQRETTLEVSDIGGLDRGRALLFSSGNPPGLLKLAHYSEKDYADDIAESETYYGPKEPSEVK